MKPGLPRPPQSRSFSILTYRPRSGAYHITIEDVHPPGWLCRAAGGGALSSEILKALKVPAGTVMVSYLSTRTVIRRGQPPGQLRVVQRTSPEANWPTLSGHCRSIAGSKAKPRGARVYWTSARFRVKCISLPGPFEKT